MFTLILIYPNWILTKIYIQASRVRIVRDIVLDINKLRCWNFVGGGGGGLRKMLHNYYDVNKIIGVVVFEERISAKHFVVSISVTFWTHAPFEQAETQQFWFELELKLEWWYKFHIGGKWDWSSNTMHW